MSSVTQHCSTPIFSTFSHCPDCGNTLTDHPKLSTALECAPDLLSPILGEYPKAKLFTGIVKSTHLYTRSKTTHSRDENNQYTEHFEHPYSFLTLEDRDGNTKKINVDASDTAAGKIAIGDAITILETMPLTIPIAAPKGIGNMLNDELADAFVVHNPDQDQFGRKNMSDSFGSAEKVTFMNAFFTFFASLVATALLAFIALLFLDPDVPYATAIPVVLACIVALFNTRSLYSKQKKQAKRYENYSQVMNSLLAISYNTLGYQHHSPKLSDSDIFCGHCDSRYSASYKHCPCCGQSTPCASPATQQNANSPSQALNQEGGLSASISEHTGDQSNASASNSIKHKRLEVMAKYQVETPEEVYVYERLLWPSERLTCSAKAGLYRVLDRNLFTESSVKVEGTNYSRKVYTRSGNYVGEIDDGSSTTKTTSINIEGNVLLEDCTGEIIEKEVYPDILGTLDVGDYVFLANQTIQSGKKPSQEYRVNASNMSKGIYAWPYDIRDHDNSSWIEGILPFLWFFLAITIGVVYDKLLAGLNFHSIKQFIMEHTGYRLPGWADGADHWIIGIVAFIVLMMMHSAFVGRIDRGNRKRANKILKPIDDAYKAFNNETLETLNKLK